jgi:dihydrofolate reductase
LGIPDDADHCPVVVGSGKRFFPDGVRLDLELVEERRFRKGVVVLRYAVRGSDKHGTNVH